ncbi:MAG: cytochrome b [Pseudomonadota bacterium]
MLSETVAHGRKAIGRLIAVATMLMFFMSFTAVQAAVPIGEVHPVFGEIGTNDHRLPYQLDSIIGLVCVALALFVAWAMNHAKPNMRVIGIGAAAITCLAVGVGIFAIDIAGYFDRLRPALFPVDDAKPLLMRIHGAIFLVAGIALVFVTMGQARRADTLELSKRNEAERYGLASRYYHWTIAFLFLLLVPMGIYTSMIPEDQTHRQAFYVIHKSLGFTVLFLAIARLIWIIRSPAPKLSAGLKGWEKFLAHGAHYALYFFLFAFPISGFMLSTYGGKLSHFFFWDTPLLWGPDEVAIQPWGLAHKLLLPYLFYLIFLAHIAGALKHQFIDKEKDSFKRIAT